MALAPPHPRQTERLRALRSYEILDTDPDRSFDEIVQLAAAICGSEIALISFVDAERQWFKSAHGITLRETPLEGSICSHAILTEELLEVEDTLVDPRTVDNPLVCGDPHLRFYAGALLSTPEGLPLGTLCVLDRAPRRLTPLQRDTLRVLAQQVMVRLEMRRALSQAEVLRREVDHRVKNSLQALSSFLRLAGRRAQAEETRTAISTLQSRLDAVATLHHELYRTDAGPVIDLSAYVENLAGHFRQIAPSNVELTIDAAPVAVSSAQAVAVGTLLNEFVANAVKHAFPGGRRGRIAVGIAPGAEAGEVVVSCADNGVGLAVGTDPSGGGLGLQVAQVISAELNSRIDAESTPDGLRLSLAFQSAAA